MTRHDRTFDDLSAYATRAWVAARLGRSQDWIAGNRDKLRASGFPDPDPIVGLYLKADVDTWIARRAKKAHPAPAQNSNNEVNYDAL